MALSGVLAVALVAPNALQLLKFTNSKKYKIAKRSIYNSRKRLVDNELLAYSRNGMLRLTKKGKKELRRIEINDYKIKTPKKWDKKWRVLIFDIKEKRKNQRDKLRLTLISIGFIKLQNSVWVYPYDCEDLIILLKVDFSFGKDVLYMIVDRIENEKVLLNKFNLRK